MGIVFSGVCYPDSVEALAAFQSTFPHIDGAYLTSLSSSSLDAAGVLVFSGSRVDLSSGAASAIPATTVQLSSCNTEFLQSYPLQDIFFVSVLVVCWALGFQSGMHR